MTDIAELFARDPHNLSDQDLDVIVQRYRQQRAQFNAGVKPVSPKKKPTVLDEIGDIKL